MSWLLNPNIAIVAAATILITQGRHVVAFYVTVFEEKYQQPWGCFNVKMLSY